MRGGKKAHGAMRRSNRMILQTTGIHRSLWLAIIAVILFTLLAISIMAGLTVGFEGWAYQESTEHMSPILTLLVKAVTHLGDTIAVTSICLFLILLPKSRMTIAAPISITVIVSFLLNLVLKNLFARERPDLLRLVNETSYSFPSGHAMINASLYMMIILLIFDANLPRRRQIGLAIACVALTIAIGVSRIYLGVHYAGDVIGGWLLGSAVALAIHTYWTVRQKRR